MSITLTLVIDRYGFEPILAFERMRLDWQDYEAFDQIKAEAVPLPCAVQWYDDEGLEDCTTDRYGAPLTYLPAYTLARHLSAAELHDFDAAVFAFLKALRPDTKVVLWWN